MTQPLVYIDTSEVLTGNLEKLKASMSELVDFVRANEPQIVSYGVYFNQDGSRMTVVHVHRDSASLQFHMDTAGHLFPAVGRFIKLLSIDVYGALTPDLMEKMRQKADMLGTGKVSVHDLHRGFGRFTDD